MPEMDTETLAGIVNTEFTNAEGAENHQISHERAIAMRRFLREPLGNEEEGQSQIVTSDVANVVDGIMPSMMRIFATAENLVLFDPVGAEDEEQARQETDRVHYEFFKKNPWFLVIFYWIFDALLQKNGIVMAYWDESKKVTYETYNGQTLLSLQELLDDPELEPISRAEREDEEGETVYDVQFRRVQKNPGKVTVENVPPDEYRISGSRSLDPNGARMVGRERTMTRSAMKEMGFDPKWVDELPAVGSQKRSSSEKAARYNKSDDQGISKPPDKSQEEVLVRQAFIKVDYDGDGIAELRHIYTAGNQVGRWKDGSEANEPADRQPFHVISPYPLPHKHFGQGVDDKVGENQDISTTLLRATIDNLNHTNNPRHAVWEHGLSENTLDDLLTVRGGAVVRFARDPNISHKTLDVPFTAGHSYQMLEYLDKVNRDRTGIDSDGEGLDAESLKHIQRSVLASFTDLRKMKVELIARIFAETGFTSLFLHIHELLLKHSKKKESIRLRGEWVEIDKKDWRTRYDMTVNIGLGLGTREQNLLHLESMWEKMVAVVERTQGRLIVKPKHIYNILGEFVKNASLKDVDMFAEDPGDALAPPPPNEMLQLQQQKQEQEQRRQQLDAQRQENERRKIALDEREMQLEHRREMAKLDEEREKRLDERFIKLEQIANALTEMELKHGQDVPGSKV